MASAAEQQHSNYVKDAFGVDRSAPLTEGTLQGLFPGKSIIGNLQQTGVVIIDYSPYGSHVEAAIRHPSLNFDDGTKQFGSPQTEKTIERALLHPVGMENAAVLAQKLLDQRRVPTLGIELEGFVHDAVTGDFVPAQRQIECAQGLREDPTEGSQRSLEELACERARIMLKRAEEESEHGNLVVDTSVPITLGTKNATTSTGLVLSKHPYIQAMGRIFEDSYFTRSEELDYRVQQALNAYAKSQGFATIDDALSALGVAGVWDIAAAHASVGVLPQKRDKHRGYEAPLELGIAIANLFDSDLATVGEFLTQSTPLHAGELVPIATHTARRDETRLARDVRALTRYHLRTSVPGEPIASTGDLKNKIIESIVSGGTTTPDRAAFPNSMGPNGGPFISPHARVRLRAFGNPQEPTARVEFVGGSSTPSVLDALARDAYLVVLWTAAMEASAHQQTPQEYLAQKGFVSASTWQNQQDLGIRHALYGAEDEQVKRLIGENLAFLEYMKRYPHLRPYISFVQDRIENLSRPAQAHTVDEYTLDPQGSIADVIIHMKQAGYSEVEILHQLDRHQLAMSRRVLKVKGNYRKLLPETPKRANHALPFLWGRRQQDSSHVGIS